MTGRFEEFEPEVSAMLSIIKPLVGISLTVFDQLGEETIKTKGDGSVVTICDFALQSLIMDGLGKVFPTDLVLGEEELGKVSPDFLALVARILPAGFDPVAACRRAVRHIPPGARCWVIDPIDGTQGFVEKGHFAIASALLVDLDIKVSVTAWPRHAPQFTGIAVDGPLIFVAAAGKGAWAVDLDGNWYPVSVGSSPARKLLYSDSTGGMSPAVKGVADRLHFDGAVAMISMSKAFVLATGHGVLWPKCHLGHTEAMWDVAPFELFVREAGGITSTVHGTPIKYADNGTVADSDEGLVFSAAGPEFHEEARLALRASVSAVKAARKAEWNWVAFDV
jgi:3'(2'), 5'-bisphosphate nucleotidase